MAYEARRNNDDEKARNDANNQKNIQAAAEIASKSGNPYAKGAGMAIKAADKLTGGKASGKLGQAMTKINNTAPGGKQVQKMSNKLGESGVSDKIAKGASMKGGGAGAAGKTGSGAQGGPSSGGGSKPGTSSKSGSGFGKSLSKGDDKSTSASGSAEGKFTMSKKTKMKLLLGAAVVLAPIILIIVIVGTITGAGKSYNSAAEIKDAEKGIGVEMDDDSSAFYTKIEKVKTNFENNGKYFNSEAIVLVFDIMAEYSDDFDYDNIKESSIKDIADTLFDDDGNTNDEIFRRNLINKLIPKYISGLSHEEKEAIADDIMDSLEEFKEFYEENSDGACYLSTGVCNYDVRAVYIHGRGNMTPNPALRNVSNLYVRLMQCGQVGNGNDYGGTFGLPLPGEDLIPFETYILGVAYAEIGGSSPKEAFKAQMIAARSYILARYVDMGGWRKPVKEGDKWILPVAACTADQVFCNPDRGCSSEDGQWKQVFSGLSHKGTGPRAISNNPIPTNSPLRTYAREVEGEVLINNLGNVIYAAFLNSDQIKFIELAKQGMNYKQILLQVYNNGNRNYGAADIKKFSCGSSEADCKTVNADYAKWKQTSGPWVNVPMGTSGKTIRDIGCLVTSVAMQIAKSGVDTVIDDFNPGTFVEFLNNNGGFSNGGNFNWYTAGKAAPKFQYQNKLDVSHMGYEEKLNTIKNLVSQPGVYVVAEVKGNTGQHWVAIDSVSGSTINMMDPGSSATSMWQEYYWGNTSALSYFKVNG